jgi:ABC-type lipoprotein export system ATPase subunit
MKITRIVLKDFHQFKDVDIDLTYPKGHVKEGQPLDKVCIIGQSATGKTTLLKLIKLYTYLNSQFFDEYSIENMRGVELHLIEGQLRSIKKFDAEKNSVRFFNFYDIEKKEIERKDGLKIMMESLLEIKPWLVFFPADLLFDFEPDTINHSNEQIIDFDKVNAGAIWNLVFKSIQQYQEEEIKLQQAIAQVAVEKSSDTVAINKAVKKLEKWQSQSVNPLIALADECLDPLLKELKLKVKREFSFETKNDIGLVKLEDLNGNEVPYHLWSTGTKQILLTAIPLYLLKPDKTLILIDEPERSLYPNLQKFVVDYYTSMTKDSQFFFATHSPIIASCFEPWEIVELKFNDEGHVYQEKYYPEGAERHVDNYTIFPSYLTYDLMLSKVFDVDETHSYERSEKMTEVLMLRNQLTQLKEKGTLETEQGKAIYNRYKDLAAKLFWDFDIQ